MEGFSQKKRRQRKKDDKGRKKENGMLRHAFGPLGDSRKL